MKTFKEFLNEGINYKPTPGYDDDNTTIHHIPTEKIENSFKKSEYHVGKDGSGGSKMKYDRAKDFISSKPKDFEVPSMHVHDNGNVEFNDGRHRYAALRDSGAKTIPVTLSKEAHKNAKTHGYI